MKKTLIALAALSAIAGAAQAQSSVTLYGRIDSSVGQTSSETTSTSAANTGAAAKLTQTAVSSSALNTTFWGLKGSEDLGGGMTANFKLESGFSVDTGTIGTGYSLFEREATVGLAGAFGSVNLGRQYTAYDSLRSATNNTWDSNFAITNAVFRTGIKSGVTTTDGSLTTVDYANRASNSIRYDSPVFAGFSGSLVYGLGENKEVTVVIAPTVANYGSATNIVSMHVKYVAGPLLVGYAHQEEKLTQTVLATAQVTNKRDLFGASYDFGVAKVTGGYNQAKDGTIKDKEYQFGVSVPFGAAAVALGYAHAKSTQPGAADLTGKGFDLVGTYNLSKRTTLYAGYKSVEVETFTTTAVAGDINTKTDTSLQAGVRHTF